MLGNHTHTHTHLWTHSCPPHPLSSILCSSCFHCALMYPLCNLCPSYTSFLSLNHVNTTSPNISGDIAVSTICILRSNPDVSTGHMQFTICAHGFFLLLFVPFHCCKWCCDHWHSAWVGASRSWWDCGSAASLIVTLFSSDTIATKEQASQDTSGWCSNKFRLTELVQNRTRDGIIIFLLTFISIVFITDFWVISMWGSIRKWTMFTFLSYCLHPDLMLAGGHGSCATWRYITPQLHRWIKWWVGLRFRIGAAATA